jgi:signal transduction histidine kinase
MKSLRLRMLAALGLVIALAWGISITMFVSYLTSGLSSPWRMNLHSFGERLTHVLPVDWVIHDTADHLGRTGEPSEPAGILTAMVLNTAELALVGIVMWIAMVITLRPLKTMSDGLSQRSAFDSTPLAVQSIPDEVRPLIVAFNSLLNRVEVAMRSERQFIADAAHELRTPLAALHVHAEVALRATTASAKDEALVKLLDVSHRTQRLAEQLLDLARLEAGLHSTGFNDSDLGSLARHVISEFRIQAEARGTNITLSGEACMVRCDVDEIGILLRNLIDNAMRHGGEFGTVEVTCAYRQRGGVRRATLEVRDDGPGVPELEREAIFQRFYRVAGSTARGSGIGLSLVAGIAELHGASIETEASHNDRGLVVRIVFP